jgi:FAD-linked sulfhydryl oxidase
MFLRGRVPRAIARAVTALPVLAIGSAFSEPAQGFQRPAFEACPEVSCKSKEELAAMFGDRVVRTPRRIATGGSSATSTAGTASAHSSATAASGHQTQTPASAATAAGSAALACPPAREELGLHAWNLLHTMAAYYPDRPSEEEQRAALGLVDALARLYPCTHCRARLQQELQTNPPRVDSRASFSLWMCEQHNAVNEALGKAPFACLLAELDQRWRFGRPECWGAASQSAEESLGQSADAEQ